MTGFYNGSEINSKLDIIDVVSKRVNLKKTGSSLIGLCPFHSEKTPSFHVNLNKQFCTIYNNQMFFNESVSNFISRMKKNDLFVLFSDTPPMFSGKRRIHFEDTIDIYFISKI